MMGTCRSLWALGKGCVVKTQQKIGGEIRGTAGPEFEKTGFRFRIIPDSICFQATVHGFAPGFFHICAQATALCIGFKPRANKKYDITEGLLSFGKADVAYAECRTLFQRLPHCVGDHYSGQPAVTQIEPHHHTDQR